MPSLEKMKRRWISDFRSNKCKSGAYCWYSRVSGTRGVKAYISKRGANTSFLRQSKAAAKGFAPKTYGKVFSVSDGEYIYWGFVTEHIETNTDKILRDLRKAKGEAAARGDYERSRKLSELYREQRRKIWKAVESLELQMHGEGLWFCDPNLGNLAWVGEKLILIDFYCG